MKKLIISLIAATTVVAARADTFTFTPTGNTDLSDLSHNSAYTWGISGTTETSLKNNLSSGFHITGATISISNLYNWDSADTENQLFMHLLENPAAGIGTVIDDPTDQGVNEGIVSDYFSGNIASNQGIYSSLTNIYLTQYHDNNGPTTKINFSYTFTASQMATLTSYISDGHTGSNADFGLGFDPDCHFFNDGITLTVTTAAVPDGGMTLALLGFGLVALAGIRRFFSS